MDGPYVDGGFTTSLTALHLRRMLAVEQEDEAGQLTCHSRTRDASDEVRKPNLWRRPAPAEAETLTIAAQGPSLVTDCRGVLAKVKGLIETAHSVRGLQFRLLGSGSRRECFPAEIVQDRSSTIAELSYDEVR